MGREGNMTALRLLGDSQERLKVGGRSHFDMVGACCRKPIHHPARFLRISPHPHESGL